MNAHSFKNWLQIRHDDIMGKEKKALSALSSGNRTEYDAYMKEKAQKLKILYQEALPEMKSLSETEQERVSKILSSFSQNASTALSLNSVFYMSALLYPDDHKEGEADNLQKLVQSIT